MAPKQTLTDRKSEAQVSVRLVKRGLVLHGHAANLSEQGIYFVMPGPALVFSQDDEEGEIVEVEIEVRGRRVRAQGEVCWIDRDRTGLGVRFVEIGGEDQARLAALIAAP
jgi:PilZ domain-containing protein